MWRNNMTSTNAEFLDLLNQVQSHQSSNLHALFLYFSLAMPGSDTQKLAIYHWLTSLPLPELSQNAMILLLIFGPITVLITIVVLAIVLFWIVRIAVPFILSKLFKSDTEKTLLQITFPADTSKSAFATEQLYTLLHTLSRQLSFWDSVVLRKNKFSLEIVSTKKEGIRYLLAAHPKFIEIISRNLLSYLPGIKVSKVDDYLAQENPIQDVTTAELTLSSHFALPLIDQKTLSENDTISYLTGNMTTLLPDERIVFQIVVSPVMAHIHHNIISELKDLRSRIYNGKTLTEAVQKNAFQKLASLPGVSIIWLIILGVWKVVSFVFMFIISMVIGFFDTSGKSVPFLMMPSINIPQNILNPYERELSQSIKEKIDQPLFETTIRILVQLKDNHDANMRLNGILASFGQLSSPYQALKEKHVLLPFRQNILKTFINRRISTNSPFGPNPILSASELADIYHFPYTRTTKTEDLAKVHSKELPAPLSVKNNTDFDVIFGKNTFGNSENPIGLTDDDRSRHVYIIGQTGSGKSTIMYHMAKDDIQKGRGVAIIDPHGDLAEDLLATVPLSRKNDCVYLNPFDLRYPVGINLLELTPGLEDDEFEQEKELVCESVISVFRRVFTKDENTDAHRIEYILRNAIYTAFTVENATIFTVYDLLNDPKYQKTVTKNLEDENLRNFWKNEFGRAGNFQVVKMVSGVTAKVGRFLFSPTAKRILEQPKSTVNFDQVLESGKILICNLAEGKLGEDTSELLGTTVIAKLQQAAMRRVRTKKGERKPFYLFIDEFQNFATSSFTKLLSGGRKFGLRLTIAEQSTSQQDDRNIVNVILANTGTVICFRTASPIDEQLMLTQFSPYIEASDIVNLPRYKFYMKLSAVEPEEPFSGTTLPVPIQSDTDTLNQIIEASRKNYATEYKKIVRKSSANHIKKSNIPKETDKADDIGTLL